MTGVLGRSRSPGRSAEAALSEFVEQLTFRTLPPRVLTQARRVLLDTLGAAAYGVTMPWAGAARAYARTWGHGGPGVVIGARRTVSIRDAALLNGLSAHGFELDDTHVPSTSHPGAVIIPALLAAAAGQRVDGRTFVTGLVAGYEIMTRIGRAVSPSHLRRGFHPTATAGVFGAAAAVASLLRFTRADVLSALGLAGSLTFGLAAFSDDRTGDAVKRLHAGRAAETGLAAALLSASGLRGPRTILEGRCGFLRAFADRSDPGALTRSLGRTFALEHISLKPYACCSNLFAAIDAVKHLMRADGLRPDEIAAVVVRGNRDQVEEHAQRDVATVGEAQHSLPYAVAATLERLIDDAGTAFAPRTIHSRRLVALCEKTTVEIDPAIDALFPRQEAAKVVVRLTNGRRCAHTVLHPKGSPRRPLSDAEVEAKFRALARASIPARRAAAIVDTISRIERVGAVEELAGLLRGTAA